MVLSDEQKSQRQSVQRMLFQTDGPVKENDLLPNSFVFTRRETKVWELDAEHNFLVRQYARIGSERY